MASNIDITFNLSNIEKRFNRLRNPEKGIFKAGEGAKTGLLSNWGNGKGADGISMKPLSIKYILHKLDRTGSRIPDLLITGDLWRSLFVKKGSRKTEVTLGIRSTESEKALKNAKLRPNMMKLGNETKLRKIARDIFFKFLTR